MFTDIVDLDGIDNFCDFKAAFPDYVSEKEIDSVAEAFELIATQERDPCLDDPEAYRSFGGQIEDISIKLDIDMSGRIDELEYLAQDLEEDLGIIEEDHEGGYSGSGSGHCSDAVIESMFNTLH